MRAWWIAIAVAVLALPVWAQDDAAPRFSLPAGRLAKGPRPADAATLQIRLLDGGALRVLQGEAWKNVTLDELGATLHGAARAYEEQQKRAGGSGYEEMGGGARASRLFVSVRADASVPWQHLQWVMTIAAEQKCYKLELCEGERALQAFLPVDRGIEPIPQKPPDTIMATIHLTARKEKPRRWGDRQVMAPTAVQYRWGADGSEDLARARQHLEKAQRVVEELGDGTRLVGEIRAGHKVPYTLVFDVVETFADLGYEHLHFFGAVIPGAELRRRKRLPFPRRNYTPPPQGPEIQEPEIEEHETGAVVDQPGARFGRLLTGARAPGFSAVEVRLLQGGALQVLHDEAWDDASLEDLAAALRRDDDGCGAGRLLLSIHADPLVPWQHLQWVMAIAAEQKVFRLEIHDPRGRRSVQVVLPVDDPMAGCSDGVCALLHVVARKETPQRWNGVEVMRPTEFRYRWGDRESTGLDAVRDHLARLKRTVERQKRDAVLVGEIRAGHKIPFARVFELIELYADLGYEHLEFGGTKVVPGPVLHRPQRLPYPNKNYDTAD